MIKQKKLVNGLGVLVVMVICALGFIKCTNSKDITCDCQEKSLNVWTDEFITNMKAGYLPDVADRLAESKSTFIYAQCINNELKNIN